MDNNENPEDYQSENETKGFFAPYNFESEFLFPPPPLTPQEKEIISLSKLPPPPPHSAAGQPYTAPTNDNYRASFGLPTNNYQTNETLNYQNQQDETKVDGNSRNDRNNTSASFSVVFLAFIAGLVGILTGMLMGDQAKLGRSPSIALDRPSYSFERDQDSYTIAEVLAITTPSVVAVDNATQGFLSAGSGVIISEEGVVLTNAHVIGTSTSVTLTLFDGSVVTAELIGAYPEEDIALLQIINPPTGLVAAELGESEMAQVGDEVLAIGNALGLGASPTVTRGIISGKDRSLRAEGNLTLQNLLQTDTAINPGNSGGPLVDAKGKVIGINTAIIEDANNVGFAIAIDSIKPLIEQIRNGQGSIRSDQAFLGIVGVDASGISEELRQEFGVVPSDGVVIVETLQSGGAKEADMRPGDVIQSINGQPVKSLQQLTETMQNVTAGQEVEVFIYRKEEQIPVKVTVKERRESGNI